MKNALTENIFIPRYFADRIITVNPRGTIGIITLWTQPQWVMQKFEEASIDLSPDNSPIVAVGTLYGNGLPELLRNLLYNPQITTLIILGRNRANSAEELINFFKEGLEEIDFLGQKRTRIKKTKRMIDNLITPDMFVTPPRIHKIGDLRCPEDLENIKLILENLRNIEKLPLEKSNTLQRITVELPHMESIRFPSNPRNHSITADDPLTAWKELIFRLVRFGHLAKLRKGDRLELQNLRVVVENPRWIPDATLTEYGFNPEEFKEYYNDFLNPEIPPGTTYTYGNRLKDYFENTGSDSPENTVDTIEAVINRLQRDPEDRAAYIALWDSARDITSTVSHPCLVSLYIRRFDEKLTLTAQFRTHNSLDAWLKNFFGLLRIQEEIAQKTGITPGAITLISNSISVDTRKLDIARSIADTRKFAVNEDPMGYFQIKTENGEIHIQHYYQGALLEEYRGRKASLLQHELYRNRAVSDINHAIYLGRMLEKAEQSINRNLPFNQE